MSTQNKQESSSKDIQEKIVSIMRHSKVVKGGRIFSFSALVVVGNYDGSIGYGYGKAREVAAAVKKATEQARRSIIKIKLHGSTLHHEIIGYHGATKVFMKPAAEGTGIIAGGAMRAVFEVSGVQNVLAKCIGSSSPVNVVRATLKALQAISSPSYIAAKRGKTINEVIGRTHVKEA